MERHEALFERAFWRILRVDKLHRRSFHIYSVMWE